MRIYVTMLTFLIGGFAIAEDAKWYHQNYSDKAEQDLAHCKKAADEFSKDVVVDKNCFYSYLKVVPKSQIRESVNGKLVALGHENAIFVAEKFVVGESFKMKIRVIAGEKTTLSNVNAIDISPNGKSVAVLDGEKVKVFRSANHGNIGPYKQVAHETIENPSALRFSKNGNDILLISRSNATVMAFSLDNDSRHPRQKLDIQSKWVIDGSKVSMQDPVDIEFADKSGGEIMVLDQAAGDIFVFQTGAKDIESTVKVLNVDGVDQPYKFQRNPASLNVINADDSATEVVDGKN